MGASQSTKKVKNFIEEPMIFETSTPSSPAHDETEFPQLSFSDLSLSLARRFLHSFFANKDLKVCQLNSVNLQSIYDLTNTIKSSLVHEKDSYFFAVKEEKKCLLTVFVAKTSESIQELNIKPLSFSFPYDNDGKYKFISLLKGFFLCDSITEITFVKVDLCDFSDLEDLLKIVQKDYSKIEIDTKSTVVSGKFINFRIWKKFNDEKNFAIPTSKTKNDADFIYPNKIY